MADDKGGPLLVLRKSFLIDSTGRRPRPVPEVLLLANRQGYLWLSRYFRDIAAKTPSARAVKRLVEFGDPDNHRHLGTRWPPFDAGLSDEMELRLGLLTPQNCRAVFRKYGITPATRCRGSLAAQYRRHIREAEKAVADIRRAHCRWGRRFRLSVTIDRDGRIRVEKRTRAGKT